ARLGWHALRLRETAHRQSLRVFRLDEAVGEGWRDQLVPAAGRPLVLAVVAADIESIARPRQRDIEEAVARRRLVVRLTRACTRNRRHAARAFRWPHDRPCAASAADGVIDFDEATLHTARLRAACVR